MKTEEKDFAISEGTSSCANYGKSSTNDEQCSSYTGAFVNLIKQEMVSFDDARTNIEYNFPNWTVSAVYELAECYIFTISPSNLKDKNSILGGYYKIFKADGEITGYSPVMDVEEFKKALANRIL